jgi:hypothetical protein
MNQLAGTVMVWTKITARPSPVAVSIFLEQARNEHMPRKKESRMFSTKMFLMARLTSSMAGSFAQAVSNFLVRVR